MNQHILLLLKSILMLMNSQRYLATMLSSMLKFCFEVFINWFVIIYCIIQKEKQFERIAYIVATVVVACALIVGILAPMIVNLTNTPGDSTSSEWSCMNYFIYKQRLDCRSIIRKRRCRSYPYTQIFEFSLGDLILIVILHDSSCKLAPLYIKLGSTKKQDTDFVNLIENVR